MMNPSQQLKIINAIIYKPEVILNAPIIKTEKMTSSAMLVDLLFHNKQFNTLKKFMIECFEQSIKNSEIILRDGSQGTAGIGRFVENILNPIFTTSYNKKIQLMDFIKDICQHLPTILKEVCKTIFDMAYRKNPNLAYRTVCTLIIFKFILPKIVMETLDQEEEVGRAQREECKTLQSRANFTEPDQEMIELVLNIIRSDSEMENFSPEFHLEASERKQFFDKLMHLFEDEKSLNPELTKLLQEMKRQEIPKLNLRTLKRNVSFNKELAREPRTPSPARYRQLTNSEDSESESRSGSPLTIRRKSKPEISPKSYKLSPKSGSFVNK
jgi:hypothetical protein